MSNKSDKTKQAENLSLALKKLQQIAAAQLSSSEVTNLKETELDERKEQSEPVSLTASELIELLSETESTSHQKADQEIETLKIKNKRLDYELEQLKTLDTTRGKYVGRLFWLIVGWLVFVLLFVALTAIFIFKLSDSVLIAFITSTTVSVLGLFVIVARWLFPSAINKDNK